MIEILPIRVLTAQDAPIFGGLNVSLGKLERLGFPVVGGIVVTPPEFKLKSVLEQFDFGSKEVIQQSLTLVKKEINAIPVPQILIKEVGNHKHFLVNGIKIKSLKGLWQTLLTLWLEEIKHRIWNSGFYPGITEDLNPKTVIFLNNLQGFGSAYFDPLQDDCIINIKSGKLHPNDLKKIADSVTLANKKLFLPHEYEWVIDSGVKISGLKPYTSPIVLNSSPVDLGEVRGVIQNDKKPQSAVKVIFDLSSGFTIEKEVDGIFITSEKIFDLNKPQESFDNLVFRVVEGALAFPNSPVFFKLADKSEGMGKVRGSLRLLHQKSLFEPLVEVLDFARHKKNLLNVHIVIPFVRGVNELLQIKRELATKKLMRKNSLKMFLEVAVPENFINLEDYLVAGIDGVVLNMDELIAHLNGFDLVEENLNFYKNEVDGLVKFLEDGIRLLHKSKIPFIAYGNISLYPKVLEYLIEKGVYGVVVERYEAHSAHDLLYQAERKLILRRS